MDQEVEIVRASKLEQEVELTNVNVAIGEANAVNFPGEVLRRNIGPFTAVAVGFNIVNALVGIGSSLAIAVAAGGTVTIIYGVIVAGFCYICVGASLGEMASVYPTAGGQYHFAAIFAPDKHSRGISYICGMVSIFSWVAICAAATILMAEAVLAIPAHFVDGYTPATWHYFLVYQAVNVFYLLNNLFFLKKAPWIHDVGCNKPPPSWSLTPLIHIQTLSSVSSDTGHLWLSGYNDNMPRRRRKTILLSRLDGL